ncbi:histidine ammonia-lyase [Sphingobacterium faecium]|uniref:histidine ammonia-lyase n=1 Tax=Sphingobacterium faecium TaxID=34087 RepID=UPI0004E5FBFB|nr:histidine ammonia-lyase [Sphingobacterium faecium]UXD71518.1 histidine ammonia-lyase [Sphingobacterium faecium]CDT22966.1 Histidine ammonia-lyase [Sphingobacterium sp. PM2-P1-29]
MENKIKIFQYGNDQLTCSIAMQLATGRIKGELTASTIEKVVQSAQYVQDIVDSNKIVYGINTGFGPLCTTSINPADTKKLQENILKSHAVGVGEPIDKQLSKLMMILKVHALAKGYSGIQLTTLERMIWFIDHDIVPIVPKQGSVGASGDLAPLSHLFLPLIGLGKVWYQNEIRQTSEVLALLGTNAITLGAKEGLALINGTQFMAAHAVKAVSEMHNLLENADLIATLMIEGLNGSIKPFFAQLHQLRPYKGNQYVASTIYNLLQDSEIVTSHHNCSRVQDPYSLRCIPQIHGASRNAWLHLKDTIEIEINSVTDNPIIIDSELTISGGSFHGQPIALPIDYATLAISEIGNVSDRRVYLSLEGDTPNVPKLLLKETGLNSGFMILQYSTAALASENKGLCFPSSADSIPTSLGQEDHVSMGSIGARKLLQVINNVGNILSIELIFAAQAFDFHKPLQSTAIMEAVHEEIRKVIPHITEDQMMEDILSAAQQLISSGCLVQVAKHIAEEQHVPYHGLHHEYFNNF